MRRRYTDIETNLMKIMAENLKGILKRKGLTQKDLAEMTGFSTSNVSDIMRGQTLLSPGNLHIVSKALKVSKGEIDPTYSNDMFEEERAVYRIETENKESVDPFFIFTLIDTMTDDQIIEKYHHVAGDGTLTEQQIRLHLQNVRLIKSLNR